MKILVIGDVVGRLGRQILTEMLPDIKKENDIDWVVANGENLAGGRGLNKKTVKEIQQAGVDIITSGNHVWFIDEGVELLKKKDSQILRPANYPPDTLGKGWGFFTNALGQKLIVINLIGRVFMKEDFDCPFRQADEILDDIKQDKTIKDFDGIVVDFHAEATSEKRALAEYLDGRVTAVVGTHTHVQTNDEKILQNGTAFMTDLGMTGSTNSVLGVGQEVIIKQFLTQLPQKFVWKTLGDKILCGCVLETKKGSVKALSISKISKYSDNQVYV